MINALLFVIFHSCWPCVGFLLSFFQRSFASVFVSVFQRYVHGHASQTFLRLVSYYFIHSIPSAPGGEHWRQASLINDDINQWTLKTSVWH